MMQNAVRGMTREEIADGLLSILEELEDKVNSCSKECACMHKSAKSCCPPEGYLPAGNIHTIYLTTMQTQFSHQKLFVCCFYSVTGRKKTQICHQIELLMRGFPRLLRPTC